MASAENGDEDDVKKALRDDEDSVDEESCVRSQCVMQHNYVYLVDTYITPI